MKILICYDKSGPKYHRCLLPAYLMDGVELRVVNQLKEEHLEGIDILFFNRLVWGCRLIDLYRWREKYGFKIISDFDDHWYLGPDHYLFYEYKKHRASDLMAETIKISDAVTVTHERLYDEVYELNKNVYVLPNTIPDFGQFQLKKRESEFTRLFWAGGITHKKDIQLLANPLKRFHFPNIQMVMGGYVKGNREYSSMASAYTNGGKVRNNLIEALPVDEYYYMYSECDIALIPLCETTFNSHKSNLKILEAANVGSPVVVSAVDPYLGFPEDLVNYVRKQSDWYDNVKKLLKDPLKAKEQGERLKEYCCEQYSFSAINNKRKKLFEYVTAKQREAGEVQICT